MNFSYTRNEYFLIEKKKKKTKKLATALQHGNHSCKVSQIAPVNQKKIVKTEFRFMFFSLFSLHRQKKNKKKLILQEHLVTITSEQKWV